MGQPSCMRSVFDRNVIMRRIPCMYYLKMVSFGPKHVVNKSPLKIINKP